MRALFHGPAFSCFRDPLALYAGPHEIRRLDIEEGADYRYDPRTESFADIIERIRSGWAPELLVCWSPDSHPPPPEIERSPIPTLAITGDWDVNYAGLARNLGRFDVVMTDKGGVEVFTGDWAAPRYFIPLYSQVTGVHKPSDDQRDIDVLFAGSITGGRYAKRARFLEQLAALSDTYNIQIHTGLPPETYAELMGRAKIVFNHTVRGELNLRTFETLAAGALAFIEEDNLEVRDWFADRQEVVLYNTVNLVERVTHYLENPEEARGIAERGSARAPQFAAENRIDTLIEWAAAQQSSGRPFLELPPLEQAYNTALQYRDKVQPVYHDLEIGAFNVVLQQAPNDPRAWAGVGNHFWNQINLKRGDAAIAERMLKTFAQAHRLRPDSIPHALNAATACRQCGQTGPEKANLEAALNGTSLEGAELVIGEYGDWFWSQWHRDTAARNAGIPRIKAECHIRLAKICLNEEASGDAEEHLHTARELDPANNAPWPLLAECHRNMGCVEDAIEVLLNNLRDMPLDFDTRARLAEMLAREGRTEAATQNLDETDRLLAAFRMA